MAPFLAGAQLRQMHREQIARPTSTATPPDDCPLEQERAEFPHALHIHEVANQHNQPGADGNHRVEDGEDASHSRPASFRNAPPSKARMTSQRRMSCTRRLAACAVPA